MASFQLNLKPNPFQIIINYQLSIKSLLVKDKQLKNI